MTALEMLMRVGLATALGIAIGIERQWRSRMAGLQTMALVSMGAALFMVLPYAFHRDADPTRIAAQIVTGIGFLGAGVIMKQGLSVTGLNTAATLWATAAVGALAGSASYREAVTGAVIVIAANGFLHPLAARMDRIHFRAGRDNPPAEYVLEVVCKGEAEAAIRAVILRSITRPGFQLKSLRSFDTTTPNEVQVRAELSAAVRDDKLLEDAVSRLTLEPQVSAVRWSIQHEPAADWTGRGTV
jgi:putative Mg2+ transporter-C (MgtC) family protein